MALLSWSSQYLIGNEVIDSEHQELFRLVNEFHSRWVENHAPQDIAKVLINSLAMRKCIFVTKRKSWRRPLIQISPGMSGFTKR